LLRRSATYAELVAKAMKGTRPDEADLGPALERLAVTFATEILQIVPGRVSVELDARLSFDTEGTIASARRLMGLLKAAGFGRAGPDQDGASTWGHPGGGQLRRRAFTAISRCCSASPRR
jgi:transaldolase